MPSILLTQTKNQQVRGPLNEPKTASAEFFNNLLKTFLKQFGELVPRAFWTYLLAQVLNQILLLGADVVISRALGPTERGLWFGLLTMLLLVAGLSSFALPISCYFYVGNLRFAVERVNNASMLFVALMFTPLLAVGLSLQRLGVFHKLPHPTLWVMGSAVLVCLEIYVLCWYGMMMGLGELEPVIRINLTSSTVFLLTVVFFDRLYRIDLATMFLCYFFYRLLAVSFFLADSRRRSPFRFRSEWNLVWSMLFFGAKGQAGNLCTMAFLRTIFFYLYRFRGASDLGIFAVAYGLSEKCGFLTNAIQFVFTRSIVSSELREAKRTTWELARAMLVGYVVVFLPICAAARVAIPPLYGAKFRGAVLVFAVLIIGAFLNSVNQIVGTYINGRLGRPGINSTIAFFALILAAVAGIWIVPRRGLLGAAAIISGTYLLQFMAALTVFWRGAESAQVTETARLANPKTSSTGLLTAIAAEDPGQKAVRTRS